MKFDRKEFWLAPMAGFTDRAFRKLCMENGADCAVSEMVSAKGLYYGDKKTELLMPSELDLKPVSLQIFGSDSTIMAEVVKRHLNHRDFEYLDINMGCPVPKIVKNGDGSALMNNPKLAYEVVNSVKKVSNKPLCVKIRKGFKHDEDLATEFAKILEDAGADMVCVHGRTREQYYTGNADWDCIAKVKQNLSIPVFANGDVDTPEKAVAILEYTKCDGVMIARGTQGKPWIFKQIKEYIKNKTYNSEVEFSYVVGTMLKQLDLMLEYKPEYIAVSEMRKHAANYLKGYKNSAKMRGALNKLTTVEQWRGFFENIEYER